MTGVQTCAFRSEVAEVARWAVGDGGGKLLIDEEARGVAVGQRARASDGDEVGDGGLPGLQRDAAALPNPANESHRQCCDEHDDHEKFEEGECARSS